jgi:hypothetical protein
MNEEKELRIKELQSKIETIGDNFPMNKESSEEVIGEVNDDINKESVRKED